MFLLKVKTGEEAVELIIKPMNYEQAMYISQWQYEEPYSIYSMDGSEECISELLNGFYYSVVEKDGQIIGYYCLGESAQVPAGSQFGAYDNKKFTDIGLGMRPDICGQGMGSKFLHEGIRFAKENLAAAAFRLTVASFNKRAINAYRKLGFKEDIYFVRTSDTGSLEFITMLL
jgi:[ribosomal protein S18]-alanine N-acetyltransferase